MADKLKIARQFISAIPHARALRLELTSIGEGEAEIAMPYSPDLIGDVTTGVVHGGAVFAMLDTCCGTAVMSRPEQPASAATMDLRIDYMRSATPGQTVTTRAVCYHMTHTVAFVRATAHDDGAGPVATATGAFTIERT